ncbi:MAG: crotonase/enoyl-CoA hydratase family protein [Actinobacteria bacterium]|nr:crotonase/enoyl-CoA hydratase family protein [Actinomycetota bacterium]
MSDLEPRPADDRVQISIEDGVADVRMVRTDKRNALDGAMFNALAAAGERLKTEPGVRAVVLSGDGPSFCAGLDFGSFQQMSSGPGSAEAVGGPARGDGNPGAMQEGRITHLGQQVCWVWQEVPVPVIAAVHGHALGGGIQIALSADIRIVHPDTQLSVREVHWGLVPDMTGTLMLSQLVRADVAKELVFTARVFDGREAHALGLATRLSETPHDDAMAMAREIAGRSPDAVRGAKSLINGLLHTQAESQFAAERRVIGSLIGRPNQVEAIMANFEKRAPSFTDG